MGTFPSYRLLVVLIMIFLSDVGPAMSCLESERQALLAFKGGLVDVTNRLDSWVDVGGGSCCDWYGVFCNNSTGHVTGLHLQADEYDPELYFSYEAYNRTRLRGTISPSLIHLKQLVHLNLSYNDFGGTRIPPFLGLMTSLKQLDMSNAGFGGRIPSQIGNLTNLDYLGLGWNSRLSSDSLQWVSSLSLLHRLDLSDADLSKAGDWLHSINGIPSLSELILSECELDHFPFVRMLNNLSYLAVLDLSYIDFEHSSSIPKWIFHLHNLSTLDLSFCSFQEGPISDGLQNLSSLRSLDLSGNYFNSSIPSWLYGFSNGLEILDLEGNILQGVISSAIGNLTSLSYLDLGGPNSDLEIGGRETIKTLGQLCRLKSLALRGVKVNQDVVDIFRDLFSSSCPSNGLEFIDLESAAIFGNLNKVSFQRFKSLVSLSMQNNSISGSIPPFSSNLFALDVSGNSFSGSLSHFLCYQMNVTKQMQFLNLGNNFLSGEIPNCWLPWEKLSGLKLNNNSFIGHIPNSMQNLSFLESLHLRNNNLSGGLPLLLRSSQMLITVDLAENHFQGEIPSWIGETNMKILSLRSNKLEGKVPHEICALSSLQILDLASNNLSGEVPECINNFTAMINGFSDRGTTFEGVGYLDDAILVIKGRVMEYTTTLNWVRIVDFSDNFFTGKIPDEVTDLAALQSLNLSHNMLTGEIPQNIGAMKLLESLDLSGNKLVGEIPSSISSLYSLNHLNLSSNNLTGPIPSSTQLQTFNDSCFADNDHLCGPPLANECDEKHLFPVSRDADGEGMSTYLDMEGFFISMAFGFVFGFWVFMLPLFCNRQWRMAFFYFLDSVGIFICKFLPI